MPNARAIAAMLLRVGFGFLLCLTTASCRADFSVATASGDTLRVKTWGAGGRGPLFIWLLNQYAETERQDAIAASLAESGASVWRVDLIEDLMQPRSAEAIRNLDGAPVAALIDKATRGARRPVVLVACDRMAMPLLRGMRAWQEHRGDNRDLAGAVLFFPNLYLGTPVAGEAPRLSGIVGATNLPVVIVQPELGVNRERLPGLLETLHKAGSPAYAWIVPGVRDYYLMQVEKPRSESLQTLGGAVPPAVARAARDTPHLLLRAARLLAGTPRPSGPAPVQLAREQAGAPAYGLIERPRQPAPDYALKDARGHAHTMADNRGRVTLVNFWATWCPPCVHEIPSMNRLAAAYDRRDFAIVSVNFKESPTHVLAFMDNIAVDFPVLIDPDGATAGRWRVFAFPSSFLIDRQGRVRYSVNTAIEWDTPEVRAVIDRLRAERTAEP